MSKVSIILLRQFEALIGRIICEEIIGYTVLSACCIKINKFETRFPFVFKTMELFK
jgi:hypothetical protein